MKKTMMMAAILLAATLTGCGSAARKVAPTQTVKQTMPRAAALTAETTTTATTTTVSTKPATEAATVATTAYAVPAITAPTTTTSKPTTTTADTAEITTKQTTTSRDADFTWFCKGVYKVSTEGNALGTYYVFSDKHTGRVDTVSGIGMGFNYEQNKNGVTFHMGAKDDITVLTFDTVMNGTLTGTMYGHTYTFTLLNGVNPDFFDAASYEKENGNKAEEQYLADKKAAESNALDYVGTGYQVVSIQSLADNDADCQFVVGVAPKMNTSLVTYVYVGKYHCMSESEWLGKGWSSDAEFFADKRAAEAKVLAYTGAGYELVCSDALANNDNANYFKIGVGRIGTNSRITYYYAGRNFCMTENEWLSKGATDDDTQNPVMNFIGNNSNGRAIMTVVAKGKDQATVSISWGSSAFETTKSEMSGMITVIDSKLILT